MKYIILIVSVLLLGNVSFAQQQTAKPVHKVGKARQPVKKKTKSARIPDPPPVVSERVREEDMPVDPSIPPMAGVKNGKDVYEATAALEKMPEFDGGTPALMRYLNSNLNYPVQALESDIQGKVIVSFTVCEDGSLCDEKVMRSIGGGCEEEALRVIKKMPKWEPGIKDGKPVKVRYVLPVVFHLED